MSIAAVPDREPGRVLVVDDNAANRYVFAQWLRRGGHDVQEAADGAEALDLLAGAGPLPEVAVLDVVLPDMTGFELCRIIKKADATADIPVVHVSASAISVAERAQGLEGGADAYLTKPVDPEELLATITAVLRYTRARRTAQNLAERLMLLNEATLRLHGATDYRQFAAAAVQGVLSVLDTDSASVYLSLSGQPVRTFQLDGHSPVVSEPLAPDLLEQIADRVLGTRTGARVVSMPVEKWRQLVPGPPLAGDVLIAVVKAHGGRPPVCVAISGERTASEDDHRLLLQIAQACSLSLESLRNYAEEHALALQLQRSFLPARLPRPTGVELAVRYVPASAHTEIGGDFYEAIDTAGGLLLVIGDVAGHSLEAAIVMGEVRHALRAFASEGHPPELILELLDTLLTRGRPRPATVTVCLVLVEPGQRRLRVANAGHIPPLLVADGTTRFVTEHGQLLGIGGASFTATTVELTRPVRLVMCTDGLVETRTTLITENLDIFEAAVAKGPEDLEELCDVLLQTFGQGKDDDIALLVTDLEPVQD
ncbi:response regulator receiver modulated serine phosphatase [Catenulispora acidiphila DSM 44928]|uniref:Response regulator receiver modulated serine phosphatase n=1 Tax=Catenulispora acidiphila (strain DSM 44928 / JCM 14897 / NBRC 102108 / NRRL B-24433 / ID139908) TaxID=479433 RepID=C7Q136_CATAD|nr:fused response regulator/phosphatase [Catenulispora acidiphila]ACU71711.1 response regulator receiver modulated serine phosphatase [Catenulispora acidiphila DSM 44928]